jgi:hypothetical protein
MINKKTWTYMDVVIHTWMCVCHVYILYIYYAHIIHIHTVLMWHEEKKSQTKFVHNVNMTLDSYALQCLLMKFFHEITVICMYTVCAFMYLLCTYSTSTVCMHTLHLLYVYFCFESEPVREWRSWQSWLDLDCGLPKAKAQ